MTAPDHIEGKREVHMADTGSSSSIGGLLAALGGLKVHDASPTIDADMPMWFMYEAPEIAPLFGHAEAGAAANRVAFSEHTGTHVDAPFHFDADGADRRQGPRRRDAAAAVLQVRPQARRPPARRPHRSRAPRGSRRARRVLARARQRGDHRVRLGRQPSRRRQRPPRRLVGRQRARPLPRGVHVPDRPRRRGRRLRHARLRRRRARRRDARARTATSSTSCPRASSSSRASPGSPTSPRRASSSPSR